MSNTIHIDIEFETHFFFALLLNLSVLYKQKKKRRKNLKHMGVRIVFPLTVIINNNNNNNVYICMPNN